MASRKTDRASQRKPKQRLFVAAIYMAIASGISACAHTLEYNPDVINVEEAQKHYPGKALLVMSAQDQAFVHFEEDEFENIPGITSLTVPVGEYTKNLALTLLNESFEGGAVLSTSIVDPSSYSTIFEPTITQFKPMRKSKRDIIDVLLTPGSGTLYVGSDITLNAKIYDSTGVLVSEKAYQSGEVWRYYRLMTDSAWTKLIQQTIFDLMVQAVTDAENVLPLRDLTPVQTSEISPSPS